LNIHYSIELAAIFKFNSKIFGYSVFAHINLNEEFLVYETKIRSAKNELTTTVSGLSLSANKSWADVGRMKLDAAPTPPNGRDK